jgi:hypothetical protein
MDAALVQFRRLLESRVARERAATAEAATTP